MGKIILGIHGLANKPPRETLAEGWEKALKEGLKKNLGVTDAATDFRLVYWASLLYKFPKHHDGLFSFDSLYDSEPYVEAAPGALTRRKDRFLDTVRASLLDLGGSAIEAARRKIGHDDLAKWILGKVARDLAFYYDDTRRLRGPDGEEATAREVLDGTLRDAILGAHGDAAGDDVLLISHSMGTIIAYNVLRHLKDTHPGVNVPLFVTLGSPLGLPYVHNQIRTERSDVRTPTIVTKRWVNFADPKDPISADIRLRDDFDANAAGVRVEDDLVSNDYKAVVKRSGRVEEKRNRHKIYGYLRTPEMSDLIQEFLGL